MMRNTNKVTTVVLTPERQEIIEEIQNVMRVRGGREPQQATILYAGLEALRLMAREGRPVVDLPAMAFAGASQALPSGAIISAYLRTVELYGKSNGGLNDLSRSEVHLFDVDAELIEVGGFVTLRGLRFTRSLSGTTQGTELLLTGPHTVMSAMKRTAYIKIRRTFYQVHIFDLVRVYPSPKKCDSCENFVTAGREPFEEAEEDCKYCATCEVANIVPLSTEDRMLVEGVEEGGCFD